MLISLFASQGNPPPHVQVPQIPAAILGSLVNQESKPAEGWITDCSPKQILTQSAASAAGLSQPLCPGELSRTGAPGTPSPGPSHRAYLCPRLGSSSLALPQPGLRYRAGSPAARAEVPSSSSSRSSTSSASWMATRICTVVSGPGRVCSPSWAMAGRVPVPRGQASRQPAIATIARGWRARGVDSAPGRDRGGRDPPHAARRAPPCALAQGRLPRVPQACPRVKPRSAPSLRPCLVQPQPHTHSSLLPTRRRRDATAHLASGFGLD